MLKERGVSKKQLQLPFSLPQNVEHTSLHTPYPYLVPLILKPLSFSFRIDAKSCALSPSPAYRNPSSISAPNSLTLLESLSLFLTPHPPTLYHAQLRSKSPPFIRVPQKALSLSLILSLSPTPFLSSVVRRLKI